MAENSSILREVEFFTASQCLLILLKGVGQESGSYKERPDKKGVIREVIGPAVIGVAVIRALLQE